MDPALLEARHVRKYFPVTKGLIFGGNVGWVHAVEDISFRIDSGETLGLVGESGCGKSTTAKLVLLLEHPTSGEMLYEGVSLREMSGQDLRRYREHRAGGVPGPPKLAQPQDAGGRHHRRAAGGERRASPAKRCASGSRRS